eukprot:1167546-Pyramimonas_sp.AAC.2
MSPARRPFACWWPEGTTWMPSSLGRGCMPTGNGSGRPTVSWLVYSTRSRFGGKSLAPFRFFIAVGSRGESRFDLSMPVA